MKGLSSAEFHVFRSNVDPMYYVYWDGRSKLNAFDISIYFIIFPQTLWPYVAILRGADETVEARCSIKMVSVESGTFPVNLHKMAPVACPSAFRLCRLAQNERSLSESCQMASCIEILPGHLFWRSCTETLHRDARPYTYCIL